MNEKELKKIWAYCLMGQGLSDKGHGDGWGCCLCPAFIDKVFFQAPWVLCPVAELGRGKHCSGRGRANWVPVVQTGYTHVQGTWWDMPWVVRELPSSLMMPFSFTLEGEWELGDSRWLEGNKWHTCLTPRRAGRRQSEQLKASQPKSSWIKLSGNSFWSCGWRGDGEQPTWIYEG